ncbi:MAG: amidase [Candidatus Saccharibacteria bacterium]
MQQFFSRSAFYILTLLMVLLTGCKEQKDPSKSGTKEFRFLEADISTIQKGYKDGTYTVKEVVQAYIDRINQIDRNGPRLHSIIIINPDAIQIAEKLDKQLKEGKMRGSLFGIPVLLKDNIDTHDLMPCTGGSRALMNSFPRKDSYVAMKLREAGAVIIGKANLSEWANFRGEMSSSGWSGVGGQTKNPYDLSRNPCGSSSGSGAAVSANLTMVAIGTETNGSIVCPSNANGIVGIKPTVGLISRSGVIPISFTQDTPGPMARTVKDAAIVLGALTGIDKDDEHTLASKGNSYHDYTKFLNVNGLKGKRIGLWKETLGKNYKVDSLLKGEINRMKAMGAVIVEIDKISDPKVEDWSFQVLLYEYKYGLNKYFTSLGPSAVIKKLEDLIAFNLKDSVELDFSNQKYLEMAQAKGNLDSPEYKQALASMQKATREQGIDKVMELNKLDAIIAPTGSPAWKTDHTNGDSFSLGSSSPAAISGYPAISVPMGEIDGLPVGISFFGRAWSEPLLLEIAYSYEQGTKHRLIPQFSQGY